MLGRKDGRSVGDGEGQYPGVSLSSPPISWSQHPQVTEVLFDFFLFDFLLFLSDLDFLLFLSGSTHLVTLDLIPSFDLFDMQMATFGLK